MVPIVQPIIDRLLLSSDWRNRRSALIGYAMLAEGARVRLRPQLEPIIKYVHDTFRIQ